MEIEEIKKQKSIKHYLFPFKKGLNRLIIVLACAIAFYFACTNREYYNLEHKINGFITTLAIECVIYLAAVWVYHGFEKDSKGE
jgi:phage gp36-like protein